MDTDGHCFALLQRGLLRAQQPGALFDGSTIISVAKNSSCDCPVAVGLRATTDTNTSSLFWARNRAAVASSVGGTTHELLSERLATALVKAGGLRAGTQTGALLLRL